MIFQFEPIKLLQIQRYTAARYYRQRNLVYLFTLVRKHSSDTRRPSNISLVAHTVHTWINIIGPTRGVE